MMLRNVKYFQRKSIARVVIGKHSFDCWYGINSEHITLMVIMVCLFKIYFRGGFFKACFLQNVRLF